MGAITAFGQANLPEVLLPAKNGSAHQADLFNGISVRRSIPADPDASHRFEAVVIAVKEFRMLLGRDYPGQIEQDPGKEFR